ncbi:hypothetical protein ACPCIZ_12810 [Streptomyces cellulosae]
MAERINPSDVTYRKRGAPTKYPWDEWMDGSMWHLRHGVDYHLTTKDFRSVVYTAARRVGLKVHTRETDHGIVVTFSRAGERVRHFLPAEHLSHVVTLTQAQVDEHPDRTRGLTEIQLVPAA